MTNTPVLPTPEAVWRRYDADEARLSAHVSTRMIELAGLARGMQVLDLATGRGEPAIPAARAVAPGGCVVGVDVSASMLAMARERADREGLTNLELRVGSAETLDGIPQARFHATLARWGLMYMDAPVVALTAARRSMVPGGALVAAVWAEPARVPCMTVPHDAVARYLSVPPLRSGEPGMFRYAELDALACDLEAAGLALEHHEEMQVPIMEAHSDAELLAWGRAFGVGKLVAGLPARVQVAWEEDVRRACAPLWRDGVLQLGGITRVVVARAVRT